MGNKYGDKLNKQIENTLKIETKFRIEVFSTIMQFMREMFDNGCNAVILKETVMDEFTGLRYDKENGVVYLHRKNETWGKELSTIGDCSKNLLILPRIFHIICSGFFIKCDKNGTPLHPVVEEKDNTQYDEDENDMGHIIAHD